MDSGGTPFMSSDIHTPFDEKHGTDAQMDTTIKAAITAREKDSSLPCALAFEIVEEHDVSPQLVGVTLDLLNFRLTTCQMGLFGHKPKKKIVKPLADISPDLNDAIAEAMVDGRLACAAAWEIANRCTVSKMTVSNACEALKIKIKPCQLGAF